MIRDSMNRIRAANRLVALFPWLGRISEMRQLISAAARWRREGWFVPVPHFVRRSMLLCHARAAAAEIFVETGTFKGGTTWSLRGEFRRILTIEVAPGLASLARERFRKFPHITVIEGDSTTVLPEICGKLDGPCLFYLDGHYSGGFTGMGSEECPVLSELGAIFTHTRVPFRIVIDDARLFGGDPAYPTLKSVEKFVQMRKPVMKMRVENDAILVLEE